MPCLENAADDPKGEIEGPAAKIADQVQGRGRRLAAPPEGVCRTGERDVVEIVPGGCASGPSWPPAGDPA